MEFVVFFFLLYCVFSNLQFLDHSLKEENSFLQKIGRLDKWRIRQKFQIIYEYFIL